jgi:hypothetical protein
MIPKDTPNGTPIVLTLDDGKEMLTSTRSNVWALGSGQLVCLVEGKVGGWAIERMRLQGNHRGPVEQQALTRAEGGKCQWIKTNHSVKDYKIW